MRADVVKPQRRRFLDQDAEDAAAAREVADRAVRLFVDADGEELFELGATLVEAVHRAAANQTYLNPTLGARIAREPPPGPPDDLSEREVEVLRLIALGHTNAEIAEQLYLSVRTVETHRAHIQQKLRLSARAELVRYALERGLVNVPPSGA